MARAKPQTDGHGNSMTNSAQWGRVGENIIQEVDIDGDCAGDDDGDNYNENNGGNYKSNGKKSRRKKGLLLNLQELFQCSNYYFGGKEEPFWIAAIIRTFLEVDWSPVSMTYL